MYGGVNLHRLFLELVRRELVRKGAVSSVAQVNGHAVHHYRVDGTGTGAPLLYVHGLAGNANAFFRVLLPAAKRFRSVWALDLPGNGFSPLPDGGALTVREQVDVLQRFVAEVIGEPAFVVGNSLGGAMAIGLAAEFPEWVRALGLIAPAGARLEEAKLAELLASLQISSSRDARGLARRLFARPPLMLMVFASMLRQVYATPAVQAVFREAEQYAGLEPQMLGSLQMPVLLLWGGRERLLPQESIEYFRAHLPPHAHVEVVPHFGHVPQVEHAREVVNRLVAFADEHGI